MPMQARKLIPIDIFSQDSRRPDHENATIFFPSEEEFEDTVGYIANIGPRGLRGKIWNVSNCSTSFLETSLPSFGKDKWEDSKFRTRVQKVHNLMNRTSVKKVLMAYKSTKKRRCTKALVNNSTSVENKSDPGGVAISEYLGEPGPEFSLHNFEKYADNIRGNTFTKNK